MGKYDPEGARSAKAIRERAGVYLTGVAIGCVLVGVLLYQKRIWVRQRQQAATAPVPSLDPAAAGSPAGERKGD